MKLCLVATSTKQLFPLIEVLWFVVVRGIIGAKKLIWDCRSNNYDDSYNFIVRHLCNLLDTSFVTTNKLNFVDLIIQIKENLDISNHEI